MDVSVIIVNYRSYASVRHCITALLEHTDATISVEVLVVDNSAGHDGCEAIVQDFPGVVYLPNLENRGFAKAVNQGISRSAGDYILLLNPDAWLANNVLRIFLDAMNDPAHDHAGCCGGCLTGPKGEKKVSWGNFPSLKEAFSLLGFWRLYPRLYRTKISSAEVCLGESGRSVVDYVSGACMLIKRSVLKEVGMFDEDFFMYFEETEWCYRLRKSGYYSVLLPSAKIVHLESTSFRGSDELAYRKRRYLNAGRKLFYKKCYGAVPMRIMQVCFFLREVVGNLSHMMQVHSRG